MTRVTLHWQGENRFIAWGRGGAPVLINYPEAGAGDDVARPTRREDDAAGSPAGGDASARGPMPTELLLIAAGACSGLDVVSILAKKRIEFRGLDIEVTGERSPDHPRFFTKVHLVYRLTAAPEAKSALERAAELSMEQYCSVSQSLRADKSWQCEVVDG